MELALASSLVLGACSPRDVPGIRPGAGAAAPQGPPNIIFLLADDQRFDALGAAGNSIIRTPHLDRLAEEGVRFVNAFCTTSICPTSRASFLTGQYASRHGIVDFVSGLTDAQFQASWPGVLRAAGYQSAFVGKWGLGGALPRAQFDLFRGFAGQGRYFVAEGKPTPVDGSGPPPYTDGAHQGHLTAHHGTVTTEFLESPALSEPFFLQLSFKAPHAQDGEAVPFQYDSRFAELYVEEPIPAPVSATEAAFASLPKMLQLSEGRTRWERRFATEEQRLDSVRSYYRLVTGIDEVVGRVRAALERRGLEERTIIVFSSDNGFFLGEHGLAGKWFPHEESIRIPLLVFDPRLPAERRGSVVDEMVLNIDLAPTLIELAGAAVPAEVQGRSLYPLLAGETSDWRRDWYYEHAFEHPTIPPPTTTARAWLGRGLGIGRLRLGVRLVTRL